jgi:prepilin-type processing-associated H-X9-DG protein
MRQIGLAILQYTQDYDEIMPERQNGNNEIGDWEYECYAYIKSSQVFACPSNPNKSRLNYTQVTGLPIEFQVSYSANRGSDRPFTDAPDVVSLAALQSPSQTIGIVESTAVYTDFEVDQTWLWGQPTNPKVSIWPNGAGNLFAGHQGHANFVFLDGHVKAMRPLQTLDTVDGGSGSVNMWTNDNANFNIAPNSTYNTPYHTLAYTYAKVNY